MPEHGAQNPTIMRATRFETLSVPFGAVFRSILAHEPKRVALILDEDALRQSGYALIHNQTVFLEDKGRDWTYMQGRFTYYPRIDPHKENCLLLVVYETTHEALTPEQSALLNPGVMRFDPMTGERLDAPSDEENSHD